MVGHAALDRRIGVRVPASQPARFSPPTRGLSVPVAPSRPSAPVFRAACSVEDGDHADPAIFSDVEDPVWEAVKRGSSDALVYAGVHVRMLAHALEGSLDLEQESITQAGLTVLVTSLGCR